MPNSLEQKLREQVKIIDYFNTYILPLNKKFRPLSEQRMETLCPFHEETDPSFHYWKERDIFHCFGCGVAGDVIRLHQLTRQTFYGERISRFDAMLSLAKLYGIPITSEELYKKETVFTRARHLVGDKNLYKLPKDVLKLANFRELNNKVIMSSIPLESKIANFEQLDAMMSLELYKKR